ncbi:MAG: hypothetical protein HPY45_11685 [Anaerolineae bacterium]|nr:hypothetical protein [Anaerolineae bacterium]
MDANSLKNQLFYLIAYMLSSARGLYDEPADYAVFRLLDATGRLLEIMETNGLTDEYLSMLKQQVDEEREGSMDEARQRQRLDHIVLEMASEMEKRLGNG